MTNRIINKFIQHLINNIDVDLRITEEYVQVSIKYMGKIVVDKKILFNIENWLLEETLKKNNKILIAYEPVWSIGTGLIPKSNELYDTINFIKKKIRNFKIIYGGSVNPKNIHELKSINNIDGFLIGGASQDPKKFIDIIKKTYN